MSLPSKVMALVEVLLETDDNIGIRELALRQISRKVRFNEY